MAIKISFKQLHESKPFLTYLSQQAVEDLDLSITISQALAVVEAQDKMIDKALTDKATALGFALATSPQDLPKRLTANDDGGFTVSNQTIEAFNKDAEAFLDSKFASIPIKPIPKSQLLESKLRTSPELLLRLGWLFDLFSTEATETDKASKTKK